MPSPLIALCSQINPKNIFVILICIFMTITILNTLIAPVYFTYYSCPLSCDVFTIPLSCIIINTITEIFGISQGRSVLLISYVVSLLSIIIVFISQKLPTAPSSPVTSIFFEQLLGGNFVLQLATTNILWSTKFIAIVFLEYARKLIYSQKIWMRHLFTIILVPFLATSVTFTCMIIIQYSQSDYSNAISTLYYYPILVSVIMQIIFGCLGIPIVYAFAYLMRKLVVR